MHQSFPLHGERTVGILKWMLTVTLLSNNKDSPELLDVPQVAAKCDIVVHPPIVAMHVAHDMVNCKNSLKDVDT
jgi:hypothetical protein